MVQFGVKPSPEESVALVHGAFQEIGNAYNLKPAVVADLREEVIEAYTEGHRHHHAITHLGELIIFANTFEQRTDMGERFGKARIIRPRILLKDMYHDIFNKSSVEDAINVQSSADLAVERLEAAKLPDDTIGHVYRGIMATAKHDTAEPDLNIAFFLDGDMSVIGMPLERYDQYDADVEAEFTQFYEPDRYNLGRMELFLKPMLKKPRLFNTDFAHLLFDGRARNNMRRELARREAAKDQ